MKTIETHAAVTEDGVLTLQVPADVQPGEHRVVVIIDEKVVKEPGRGRLKLAAYPVGLVSENVSFRRRELYDDDNP